MAKECCLGVKNRNSGGEISFLAQNCNSNQEDNLGQNTIAGAGQNGLACNEEVDGLNAVGAYYHHQLDQTRTTKAKAFSQAEQITDAPQLQPRQPLGQTVHHEGQTMRPLDEKDVQLRTLPQYNNPDDQTHSLSSEEAIRRYDGRREEGRKFISAFNS